MVELPELTEEQCMFIAKRIFNTLYDEDDLTALRPHRIIACKDGFKCSTIATIANELPYVLKEL